MKLLASLFVMLLLVASSGAVAVAGLLPPEERAKALTDRMKDGLGLSEAQAAQIATINLEHARQVDVLRTRRTTTHDENVADLRDAKVDREAKFKAVLDAKQWALYQQKKDDLNKDYKAWAKERHSQGD